MERTTADKQAMPPGAVCQKKHFLKKICWKGSMRALNIVWRCGFDIFAAEDEKAARKIVQEFVIWASESKSTHQNWNGIRSTIKYCRKVPGIADLGVKSWRSLVEYAKIADPLYDDRVPTRVAFGYVVTEDTYYMLKAHAKNNAIRPA